MKIILDTNFLMAVSQFKIDIFDELKRFPYKVCIIDKTIRELKGINNMHSKIALRLIRNIPIINTKTGKTDDILIGLSEKGNIIATQDKELKKQLKSPYLVIRQKKYIKLINQNIY